MTTETDKIVKEEVHKLGSDISKHWDKVVNPKKNILRGLDILECNLKSRLNEYLNTRQFVPIKSISEGKTGYTSGESRKAICENCGHSGGIYSSSRSIYG